MVNHRLDFARSSKVNCLNCGCLFVQQKNPIDIFDNIYCVSCNHKEQERILQLQELTSIQYEKAPLKRQKKQNYKNLSL